MASSVESFLTYSQEQQVIEAIRLAEKQTSGEIRVHLEDYDQSNVYERAQEVFHLLKMDNTKLENGVILYVAVNLKQFVVYGDAGIDQLVGSDFWHSTRDVIQEHFKKQHFGKGLVLGVTQIGQALKKHFPWDVDDTNELSDEISKL
ncbi:TPM domain-containing protein [Aquimarina agarilytica]|uniref:TPM domain-containing protein n=1 Tax=Aquimarina agarilytica TaxID=1087449 RepID=UPI000287C60C|nr:TPM domain-containing protein [Aquimarina agarilytica]